MSKKTRIKACELAALVLAHRQDREIVPNLWACAVFFERYIESGSNATLKEFGPKEPIVLKAVKK